jgi:hydrogenase maturation protein HypF
VQGVGFRPFVYRLARQLQLSGSVRNTPQGVIIECQGPIQQLEQFESQLSAKHPVLASIRDLHREVVQPLPEAENDFHIEASASRGATQSASLRADVTVDTAACPACVREILTPTDRRHRYALTNCTDCGPRFSIIRRVPYDRPNTTMSHFDMCPACSAEYTEPSDRRFHAQPIACHDCGPKLSLIDSQGEAIAGDPIDVAREMLLAGKILAIKGLGGFHLAVRADDQDAVKRLRQLKKRDYKPFALMVESIESARELVDPSDTAIAAMQSPACPIVLTPRRDSASVADAVAPGQQRLGVMLPYTPLHHLLFKSGISRMPTLVMTSGNSTDEPLAISNDDAIQRLSPMCDAILLHDRPIQRGVDDSVVIDIGATDPIVIRRARGYVPKPIQLPPSPGTPDRPTLLATPADNQDTHSSPPYSGERRGEGLDCATAARAPHPSSPLSTGERGLGAGSRRTIGNVSGDLGEGLCLGGELKSTIAVVTGNNAILSHHLGDLTHPRAFDAFRKAVDDMRNLFHIEPMWIAHDLHPMYVSTTYAKKLSAELRIPLIPIQHHHAHAASVMAENGVSERILALVCDGTGYGTDGTIWGGELIAADFNDFSRVAHLRPLRLSGGDAAARDTARCGMALLWQALGDDFAEHPAARRMVPDPSRRQILARMIRDDIACARSSGAGRYFDGVAALLGICGHNHFEAQAAMALEAAVFRFPTPSPGTPGEGGVRVPLEFDDRSVCRQNPHPSPLPDYRARGQEEQREIGNSTVLDLSPLVRELLENMERGDRIESLAHQFHEGFVQAWAAVIVEASARMGLRVVGLSGGVFCNAWLTQRMSQLLSQAGLKVLRHRVVPPNDGGLSLGQAAIAMRRSG